jgi:DNA-directed RNA polymerase II subunit RPB2
MPREMRFNMGECKNDIGGYFIIDGKEKSVVPQEKFGDNMLRVSKEVSETVICSAEIKSVSENTAKPIRTLRIEMLAPSPRYSNYNIVVTVPNVRKPVPLFIVFRALGIITDKQIVEMCLLNLEKNEGLIDLFIPSVHDAGPIMTQAAALHYIAHLTKTKTATNALYILTDYFLPHIGETNFKEKALFLGYMVQRMLAVHKGIEQPVDRDSFRYKRIELVGTLMDELFREYYKMQFNYITVEFEKKLYYNAELYENDLHGLVMTSYKDIFKNRIVEEGFRKAFKGNWGAAEHSKRIGVVQDLNRLSFNSALSHLRKTNLSVASGAKLVGPRVLNGSQWGLMDPIDTPDGGNIGLHKQMCIMTQVSRRVSREPMIAWLKKHGDLQGIEEQPLALLANMTKVFVNGYWAGVVTTPFELVNNFKAHRRNGLIPLFMSICFESATNIVSIFTDEGRLCRPIYYYDTDLKRMSYTTDELKKDYSWTDLLHGFNKREKDGVNFTEFYNLNELYSGIDHNETNPNKYKRFIEKKGIIDYIDPNEEETALIALHQPLPNAEHRYTHCEIHESLIFGMMCNLVIYPHHNPATRNSFSTGQSKQAVSLYHTNYTMRMDKTAVLLNQGQKPLVKSRYYDYICHEEHPYGENAIVALMCYTGYNVEDAVLINEGALQRGLFRTTYFTVYEAHEERTVKGGVQTSSKQFVNIGTTLKNVRGIKAEYDYSKLDEHGLVKEGTEMTDRTIVIGCAHTSAHDPDLYDASKTTKKGQLGIVDKTYITEGEEGTKIAKVRIREERMPAMGDKMASRSGQKGTIGQIIREQDMPFTKNGLRPDIIVNPHAMPTRMTVGQLVECLVGKSCLELGYHGDCTAFMSSDKQIGAFGEVLNGCGYHSSGNEILYNGMTGEQLEAEVYIGPNYYMRLKHMVKDKVNYRSKGPRMMLTRQPVGGRANDGGLRIGEMERDVMIAHGATDFLRESMLDRGDHYYMAVCNKTGGIAVYNPEKNLFLSPLADGPLRYTESLDGKNMQVEQITKYGRDFSVVKVPYVFKLLMHELQAINVKMCIITEDNINQFDTMNFSNNIMLLTNGQLESVDDVKNHIRGKKKPQRNVETQLKNTRIEDVFPSLEKTENYEDDWSWVNGGKAGDRKASAASDHQNHRDHRDQSDYHNHRNHLNHDQSNQSKETENSHIQPVLNTFEKGQPVIFAGDFKKDRVWTIEKIIGNYATIQTTDTIGLDDNKNVVRLQDLQKMPEMPLAPVAAMQEPVAALVPQAPTQAALPNITIVTGNGNEVSAPPPPTITTTPTTSVVQGGAVEQPIMIKKPAPIIAAATTVEQPVVETLDRKSGPITVQKLG